jgi:large subunit ribosomal protein L4
MKFDLYKDDGSKTGTIDGSDDIFAIKPNIELLTRALHRQQGNARQSSAHTKTRSEVNYSTAKIYRQKGTGRARHGARSANVFRGGGVTFGPRNTRNWKTDMPKKQRRIALFSALSQKADSGKIFALEAYTQEPKTKNFATLLQKLPIEKNVLVVLDEKNSTIERSANNIPAAKTITAQYLNIADILKYDSIMFLSPALKKAEELFLSQ